MYVCIYIYRECVYIYIYISCIYLYIVLKHRNSFQERAYALWSYMISISVIMMTIITIIGFDMLCSIILCYVMLYHANRTE